MNKAIKEYMSKIGRKGGAKSRRKLTKEQAQAMARARWDKNKKESA
jgi:hypothetical protein